MTTTAAAPSAGPRTLPRPRTPFDATAFNGVYMRPNLSADGTIPASGPFSSCPDIWPNGQASINNYQTVLAGSDATYGYAQSSSTQVTEGMDNYIYVRGKNGSSSTLTKTVALFYSPSGVIQWPSQWQPNQLKTDQGNQLANIAGLASGQVGVGDRPFVWSNVQPPPPGSDHYCLISWVNDANDSNPFPDVTAPLDLGTLITNNLGWGWRNISLIANPGVTWEYPQPLNISNTIGQQYTYTVYVQPFGYTNWNVGFACSQNDAKGNPIALSKTAITQDGVKLGVDAVLDPGFTSSLTVYMYNDNNVTPASGAHVVINATYTPTTEAQVRDAVRADAIDWRASYGIRRPDHRRDAERPQINPQPVVPVGAYTFSS